MDSLLFDKLPTDNLTEEVETCRFLKQHPPNDYLIKDLWFIVLSFLFGFTDTLFISVPLSDIVHKSPNSDHVLFQAHKYITYFYGLDLKRRTPGMSFGFRIDHCEFITFINGYYPLAFVDHENSVLEIATSVDFKNRCLLQLTFEPKLQPKPTTKWFTWYGNESKTFFSKKEVCDFFGRNSHVFYTDNGHLYYVEVLDENSQYVFNGDLDYVE